MAPDADTHTPLADGTPLAEAAVEAFLAGLAAAQPDVIVKRAVRQGWLDDWLVSRERPHMIDVLAVGKAAPRMVWGLVEAGVPFRGLGVAPRGIAAPGVDTFRWLAGEHPVPGEGSFAAGAEVMRWCDELPRGHPVLVLLSGGASSCMEAAAPGIGAASAPSAPSASSASGVAPGGAAGTTHLIEAHEALAREGLPIAEWNRRRATLSALKGGRLGARLLQRTDKVRVWILADTDSAEAPAVVGGAPFWQANAPERIPHRILASVEEPVVAAGLRLAGQGWSVYRHGLRIRGPLGDAADAFAQALDGLPRDRDVALVAGGEADLAVPASAPPGGRAQHAALLLTAQFARTGSEALALCAATDGVDGGTVAAGAWATRRDWSPAAEGALRTFSSHSYFEGRRRLLSTGPTGTNLNDVWIALRKAQP